MLMIAPPSPAAMREPNKAERRNGPLRLTAITLSNSSSLVSSDEVASGDHHHLAGEIVVGSRRRHRVVSPIPLRETFSVRIHISHDGLNSSDITSAYGKLPGTALSHV